MFFSDQFASELRRIVDRCTLGAGFEFVAIFEFLDSIPYYSEICKFIVIVNCEHKYYVLDRKQN